VFLEPAVQPPPVAEHLFVSHLAYFAHWPYQWRMTSLGELTPSILVITVKNVVCLDQPVDMVGEARHVGRKVWHERTGVLLP